MDAGGEGYTKARIGAHNRDRSSGVCEKAPIARVGSSAGSIFNLATLLIIWRSSVKIWYGEGGHTPLGTSYAYFHSTLATGHSEPTTDIPDAHSRRSLEVPWRTRLVGRYVGRYVEGPSMNRRLP